MPTTYHSTLPQGIERLVKVAFWRIAWLLALYFALRVIAIAGVDVANYELAKHRMQYLDKLLREAPAADGPAEGPKLIPNRFTKDSARSMRTYLSARFELQQEMRRYAEQLSDAGIEVVSAWHNVDSHSSDGFSGVGDERLRWLAMLDLQQLVGTNALVTFGGVTRDWQQRENFHPDRRTAVEFGVGLALGKRLLLVGGNENQYHTLPDVEHFLAWPECFNRILELRQTDALNTAQAAAEANVTQKQLMEWIRNGSLPAAKRNGRYVIARNHLDQAKAQYARRTKV